MIDEELIQKVAQLAKLTLTQEEINKFSRDFEEILNAFRVLDEVDVSQTKSSFKPIENRDVLREDTIADCITQDAALKFTKNKQDGFFIGPKTTEK